MKARLMTMSDLAKASSWALLALPGMAIAESAGEVRLPNAADSGRASDLRPAPHRPRHRASLIALVVFGSCSTRCCGIVDRWAIKPSSSATTRH